MACVLLHRTFTTAAPATPKNGISTNTTVNDNPHSHFSFDVFPTPVHLDPTAVLINGLDALASLALEDDKTRNRVRRFRSSDYTDVKISVVPKGSAKDFSSEVASLCIYYGIEELARYGTYVEATFTCKWDSIEVARVDLDAVATLRYPKLVGDDSDAHANNTSVVTARGLPGNEIKPNFVFLAGGHSLLHDVVFITLMNAILRFSPPRATELFPSDVVIDAGLPWKEKGYLDLAGVSGGGDRPSSPPYLDYHVVIESLRQVPRFMLGKLFKVRGTTDCVSGRWGKGGEGEWEVVEEAGWGETGSDSEIIDGREFDRVLQTLRVDLVPLSSYFQCSRMIKYTSILPIMSLLWSNVSVGSRRGIFSASFHLVVAEYRLYSTRLPCTVIRV